MAGEIRPVWRSQEYMDFSKGIMANSTRPLADGKWASYWLTLMVFHVPREGLYLQEEFLRVSHDLMITAGATRYGSMTPSKPRG